MENTTCAIVGGGPAGLVLGLLLARRGIEVTVLEKHADFLRDFRGDTVHPSTLTALTDLGLFERFDRLEHSRISRFALPLPDGTEVVLGDMSRLKVPHPYIAMVPQWDLLDLLAEAAAEEPGFTLLREHEVTGVLREDPHDERSRVVGVEYTTPAGPGGLRAELVIGCDGRWSTVREAVDSTLVENEVPFDVWWFRVPAEGALPESFVPRLGTGQALIVIPRKGYHQMAWITPRSRREEIRAAGIAEVRRRIAEAAPGFAASLDSLGSMDDLKFLEVRLDRLESWSAPGVLCIGDAAHAMSPVGGVGINLAIQDAIAAGRILARPLEQAQGARSGGTGTPVPTAALATVQFRRESATRAVQRFQRILHAGVITPALRGRPRTPPRPLVLLFRAVPGLTRIPARFIGLGPQPERIPDWARR